MSAMNVSTDGVIIGGGVIGLTVAFRLAQAGQSVALLERGQTGREASWAGAGILPPGDSTAAATSIDRFRCRSVELYPSLTAELRQLTAIDNEYRVSGGIEFLAAGEQHRVDCWRSQNIVAQPASVADLLGINVPLGLSAFVLPEFAQVRNPRHLKALRAACVKLGVRIHEDAEVVKLSLEAGRIAFVETHAGSRFAGGHFVAAAGSWSSQLLGLKGTIRPIRGEMLLYRTEVPLLKSILLLDERYLVPRRDGHLLIGSTEADGGDFLNRTTEAGLAELRAFAASVLPALRNVKPIRSWAGLRPGTADGLPYIGFVPGADNLILAAGHYRSGLQLSPATAELVVDLILERGPFDPDFVPLFAADRIPNTTYQRTFRS